MFGRKDKNLEVMREAMEAGASIAMKSFRMGCSLTLEALERDGRLRPVSAEEEELKDKPFILDEFGEQPQPTAANLEEEIPDVLVEGSKRFAEQMFETKAEKEG